MDPVTAALQLANTIALIVLEAMRGQPEAVRHAQWERYIAFMERWDKFWARLRHTEDTP